MTTRLQSLVQPDYIPATTEDWLAREILVNGPVALTAQRLLMAQPQTAPACERCTAAAEHQNQHGRWLCGKCYELGGEDV